MILQLRQKANTDMFCSCTRRCASDLVSAAPSGRFFVRCWREKRSQNRQRKRYERLLVQKRSPRHAYVAHDMLSPQLFRCQCQSRHHSSSFARGVTPRVTDGELEQMDECRQDITPRASDVRLRTNAGCNSQRDQKKARWIVQPKYTHRSCSLLSSRNYSRLPVHGEAICRP